MASEKINNRRIGPDTVIKAIKGIAGFSWILVIIIFIVFSIAKPGFKVKMIGGSGGGFNESILKYAFYLMIFQALLCSLGIIINTTRLKRKSDKLYISLIILGGLSILGIVAYLIYI
jgi:hypothetical protein